MALWLSSKVVALHVDNSTAKTYLCNQGGMATLFHSRVAWHILNQANQHGFTHIPAYISTHLSV